MLLPINVYRRSEVAAPGAAHALLSGGDSIVFTGVSAILFVIQTG